MTDDKSREAFERWFDGEYGMDFTIGEYRRACESWQAALRYRDEQEKEMAAHHVPAGYTTDVDGSIVKGSVYDDSLDSPDRDEQEKRA